jgi:hypothetical protein
MKKASSSGRKRTTNKLSGMLCRNRLMRKVVKRRKRSRKWPTRKEKMREGSWVRLAQ